MALSDFISGEAKTKTNLDDFISGSSPKPKPTVAAPDVEAYNFDWDAYPSAAPYRKSIEAAEAKHKLPKGLLPNVILHESNFNPASMSKAGAIGLMQIVPRYHPDASPLDAEKAIDYGAGLYKKHYDKYKDWDMAKAAYNMGPGNLKKVGPRGFEETANYIDRINEAKVKATKPEPEPEPEVKEPHGVTGSWAEKETPTGFNFPMHMGFKYGLSKKVSEVSGEGLYGEGVELRDSEEKLLADTKTSFIKKSLDKLTSIIGVENESKLSNAARAQAVVMDSASREGIPLDQYRNSPELIEKAASAFVNTATFGIVSAIREETTGEIDFPATNTIGGIGTAVGTLGGFFFGPVQTAKVLTRPFTKFIPRATQEGHIAGRILMEALHDATLLGVAGGLTQLGEASKSVTFSQAAGQIWEGTKSGALTGIIFGAARGVFPKEGLEKAARIITGLVGLNAQRAIEVGGNPFTDRPIGNVVFDTLMDVVFLWKGLPKADFNKAAADVDNLSKQAADLDTAKKVAESTMDEDVKAALDSIVETKQKQFDLTYNEYVKTLGDNVAIAEEIMWDAEQVARAKTFPPEVSRIKKRTAAEVRAVMERAPEGVEPDATFKSKKGHEYFKVGEQWYDSERKPVTNTFKIKAAEKGKVDRTEIGRTKKDQPKIEQTVSEDLALINELEKNYGKSIDKITDKEIEDFLLGPEPITDVDEQMGIDPDSSFYLTSPEETELRKATYTDPYQLKWIKDNPEKYERKLLNDMNRWYGGDESIDVEHTRNELTKLNATADEFLNKLDQDGNAFFLQTEHHMQWKEGISTSSTWARGLERPKIERTDVRELEPVGKVYPPQKFPEVTADDPYKSLADNLGRQYDAKYLGQEEGITAESGEKPRLLWSSKSDNRVFRTNGLNITELRMKTDMLKGKKGPDGGGGTKLYSGIPIDELTGATKEAAKLAKEFGLRFLGYEDGISWYGMKVSEGKAVDETTLATAGVNREKLIESIRSAEERFGIPKDEYLRFSDIYAKPAGKGFTAYSGLDPKEVIKLYKTIKDKIKSKGIGSTSPKERAVYKAGEWYESFEDARNAKRFKLKRFLDRSGLHTGRAIHEKKFQLRSQLIKEYGKDGYRMLQYIDAGDAADGRADRMFYEMRKEAYKGVPKNLTTQIDAVDLIKRLKDIYRYKTAKEFKGPKGMNAEQTAAVDKLVNLYMGMTVEERAVAEKASAVMSDHVRLWVDDMVRVGLKSEEEGKLLKSHDYRKIRSFNIEKMFDQKYKIRVGDKLVRQSDSGIDPLGKNAISMIETDSRILYKETANRIYRRVSNQETKLEWKDFDEKYLDNPLVIFQQNDKAAGRPVRKIPKGWVRDFWYDNGKKQTMYYHPDVALQLLSIGGHMSYPLTRVLTTVLGVNLTRALAVGTSAMWATTRGITMDLGHTFFSARSFDSDTGKYKRTFSRFAPKYVGQIGKDMGNTFHDVMSRGEKTGVYEKNGGVMPFLAMRESHFMGRGIKPPNVWNKALDGLSFWGQSMERWNRVAVMERSLKQQAEAAGITLEGAYKNRDMTMEATNVAVERLPYRQGGWLVKEIDKVFGPFISASYNAGRTFGRGAKENPVDFWARVANIAIPTVGMTTAMALFATEANRDIPEWKHINGPTFTLFPDSLNFIDEEGNKRWITFTVPSDPIAATFYNIFRGLTNKMLYETGMSDIEPDYQSIVDSVTRSLPTDTPLSPTLAAYFAYFHNLDTWKNRSVVDEAFDWPKSGEEGQRDPKLGQLAKDVGKATGLSAPRLKAAGRNLGLQSNEYTWAIGKIYDLATSDLDPRLKKQHWAMTIAQTPGLRNLMGVTVPRAYRQGDRGEMLQDESFNNMLRREEFNAIAEGYYWKGVGNEADVDKFIDKFEEKHIIASLERKKKFVEDTAHLPHRSSWSSLFHTTPKFKAKDFYKIWKAESSPAERSALNEELDRLLDAGYVGKESEGRFFDVLDDLRYNPQSQGLD